MTAPGAGRPDTPIAGLVELALTAPTFQQLIERTAERPGELSLVGPARARLFVAGALAQPRSVTGGHRDRSRSRRPDRRTARGLRRRGGVVPVLGDTAARTALTRRRHRGRPPDAAAPIGASRRRSVGPAPAGGGDSGALFAAADEPAAGLRGTGHVARRCRNSTSRVASPGWSSWPTPGWTWSGGAASSPCAAAFSTSSPRPPSTRCASSSGVTRSPRCGCSRSPISAPSPRSRSRRWSRWPAASYCLPTRCGHGRPSWPAGSGGPSTTSPAASPRCWPSSPRASRSTAWRRSCRCFVPATTRC